MFVPQAHGLAMRGFNRATLVVFLVVALTGVTCAFPTDKSDEVRVVIQAPTLVVIRGQQLPLFARAFRVSGTDTIDIKNIVFQWISTNTTLATVQDSGGGHARVTGVNSGTVQITARATAFEQADVGSLLVRVSNPLEIDSMRPDTVRYGEVITLYGIGVDSIFQASLAGATLFPYPFSAGRDSTGYARLSFWVPPPARTDSLFYIGNGVFGFTDDSVEVIRQDLYEPNEALPHVLDLDGSRPFPGTILDPFLFLNPALSFEPLPREVKQGVDWYRLTQSGTRDLTVILTAGEAAGTFATFLTDSLAFRASDTTYFIGSDAWTLGPSSHACHGLPFVPPEAVGDSTVVALKGVSGSLDAVALYGVVARYGLAVIEAYVSELPADDHEEDSFCNAADLRGTRQATFQDTLTIENPHAIDWIRFHYTQGGFGSRAQLRLQALPGANPATSKDLDLFVLAVPQSGDTALQVLFADTATGSSVNRTVDLPTGDYYLVVLDYAGASTTYVVCVGTKPSLAPGDCDASFPSPPAGVAPLDAVRPRPRRSDTIVPPLLRRSSP
jgi:hypothetical protein